MNLAFSEDEETIREEFRTVLTSSSARNGLSRIEQHAETCDAPLCRTLAETGWLAAGIPEAFGGSELPATTLCVLAEEVGRSGVAVPYTASVCGFGIGLALAAPCDAQSTWLPRIADGSAIGIVLTGEDWAEPPVLASGSGVELTGTTHFVGDGAAASVALTCIGSGRDLRVLLLELKNGEAAASLEHTLDVLHPPARFRFERAPATVLAEGESAHQLWRDLMHRYALYVAFEQLGGAQTALETAREYSLTRYAFGRAIGSFQALKHTMADMLASIEVARSNCYFGAASLSGNAEQLQEAAAVARISASEAFRFCARQSIQIHGGIGVTWESDAHFLYRRAQALANAPGSQIFWKEYLVDLLRARHAHAA